MAWREDWDSEARRDAIQNRVAVARSERHPVYVEDGPGNFPPDGPSPMQLGRWAKAQRLHRERMEAWERERGRIARFASLWKANEEAKRRLARRLLREAVEALTYVVQNMDK